MSGPVVAIILSDDRDTQIVLSSDAPDVVRSCALGMLADVGPATDALSATRLATLQRLAQVPA